MPSARRRRFSVQNEMINHDTVKLQNETQIRFDKMCMYINEIHFTVYSKLFSSYSFTYDVI